jgi:hypothetical protein
MRIYYFSLVLIFILSTCQTNSSKKNNLVLQLKNANPEKIYLYQTAAYDEPIVLIDSTFNNLLDVNISLNIPDPNHKIYQLIISPYLPPIYFVNDTSMINIDVDLNNFVNYQIDKGDVNQEFSFLNKLIFPKSSQLTNESISFNHRNKLLFEIDSIYYDKAIHTKHAEIALFAASQCKFENQVERLNALILILQSKFSNNGQISEYVRQSKKYIDTKNKEYNIGDTIPNNVFKDLISKKTINTQQINADLIIYDFFSVLQRNQNDLNSYNDVVQHYGKEKVKIFSFPVDPDSALIHEYIKNSKVDWPHISDYLGWQGEIIPKFYIDSVPYLFVTDNNGIIIHKNIPVKRLFEKSKN